MEKIEFYEETGSQGGITGIRVNFEKKTIVRYNSYIENITEEHFPDIEWCIKNNIINLKKNIKETQERLELKETIKIPIPNGYKIREPLSEKFIGIYKDRLKNIKENLEFLENFNVEQLI